MELTVTEIARVLGAKGDFPEKQVAGFAIDSRQTQEGEVFFAIQGANADGHEFAGTAQEKGAVALVGERPMKSELPQIIVPNTEEAMIRLGHYYFSKFSCDVVGVTGTAGKTTTKELLAQMIGSRYKTAKNEGNRNTPIGLPMAMKVLQKDTEVFVAEMSGSFLDEIPRLLRIVRPRVAVVTNVGPSHLETLGTINGVAKAKGQLVSSLPPGGVAVLNADDPRVAAMAGLTRCKKTTYGSQNMADVEGRLLEDLISVKAYGLAYTFRSTIPSIHFLYDVLAAMAAALEYGVPLLDCVQVAESFKAVSGRGVLLKTPKGINIIDESYNANPVSMKETLKSLSVKPGRRYAVLADMLQLGEEAISHHAKLGEFVSSLRLDGVFCFGNLSRHVADNCLRALHYMSKEELLIALFDKLSKGDWVLVKGSNGMGMKEVVEALLKEER